MDREKFLCINCGKKFKTKSAKRSHKRKKCAFRTKSSRDEAEKSYGSKSVAMELHDIIGADLPDGAYWALGEELGVYPEDYV